MSVGNKHPTTVNVRITIMKILTIEPHLNSYTAEFIVQATWNVPNTLKISNTSKKLSESDLEQHKMLLLSNVVSVLARKEEARFFKEPGIYSMIRYMLRLKAVMSFNSCEVDYPFERVSLPIYITTVYPSRDVVLVQDQSPSFVMPSSILNKSRWVVKKTVMHTVSSVDYIPHSGVNNLPIDYIGIKHSLICYKLHVLRKLKYYFFTFFLQHIFLALTSFSVFCINHKLLHFRLLFSVFSLVITSLFHTFALSLTQCPINYHQIFYFITWLIQMLLVIWHYLINIISYRGMNDLVDKYAALFAISLYILLLSIVFVSVLFRRNYSNEKVNTRVESHFE